MIRFWDAAIIEDGVPEYKLDGNKQIYTQEFSRIYKNKMIQFKGQIQQQPKENYYYIDYFDFEDKFDGLITVEAEPISVINDSILYRGNFKIEYKFQKEEEDEDEEEVTELLLSAENFTIQMTGRYDGARHWCIVLNPGLHEIILDLEIGYYASILKADADANKILKTKNV